MSRIGNKKEQGFSFIEAIVAVTVLSVGILFVFKAFFISLDYIGRLAERAQVFAAVENRVNRIQEEFARVKVIPGEPQDLNIRGRQVTISYTIQSRKIESQNNLREVQITARWTSSQRTSQLFRSFYLIDL